MCFGQYLAPLATYMFMYMIVYMYMYVYSAVNKAHLLPNEVKGHPCHIDPEYEARNPPIIVLQICKISFVKLLC